MSPRKIFFVISCLAVFTSCKKYLDVGAPSTQLVSKTVFRSDATAVAAQLAIYEQMESEGFAYNIIVNTGLSSDELTNHMTSSNYAELASNNLTPDNGVILSVWSSLYKYIYEANAVLEGVQASTVVSESTRAQLMGEAKFTRAFCHYYLANLFGSIPLALSSDYRANAGTQRRSLDTVYSQIISDLSDASQLLSDQFSGVNGGLTQERVRPTKWAALAMLARVYLCQGNWRGAIDMSSRVISNTALFGLVPDLDKVFLKNSKEAIWQLQSVVPSFNSFVGAILVTQYAPSTVALSQTLVKSFEPGDIRANLWIHEVNVNGHVYYYPYKYKVGQGVNSVTEYTMVLRLAELYLIRAEAYAMTNDLASAVQDINFIRARASLGDAVPVNQSECLGIIRDQRRAELFTEFGDRWLYLKSSSAASEVLQMIKGADWTPGVDELYPIPQSEIVKNFRLSQNPGY